MEYVNLYGVMCNTDLTEGRGLEYIKQFCASKTTAKRLAKRAYIMGSDAPIVAIQAIEVNGTLYVPGVRIEQPSIEDKKEEEEMEQKRIAQEAKNAALEKAKSLGMTEEDIKALMGA